MLGTVLGTEVKGMSLCTCSTHTYTHIPLSLGLKDAVALFWKASVYCLLTKPQFINTSSVHTNMNCNRDESLFSLDLEYIALPLTTQENAVGKRFTLHPGLHSCKEASSQPPISWFITISTQVSLRRAQIQGNVILFETLPKNIKLSIKTSFKGKRNLRSPAWVPVCYAALGLLAACCETPYMLMRKT